MEREESVVRREWTEDGVEKPGGGPPRVAVPKMRWGGGIVWFWFWSPRGVVRSEGWGCCRALTVAVNVLLFF